MGEDTVSILKMATTWFSISELFEDKAGSQRIPRRSHCPWSRCIAVGGTGRADKLNASFARGPHDGWPRWLLSQAIVWPNASPHTQSMMRRKESVVTLAAFFFHLHAYVRTTTRRVAGPTKTKAFSDSLTKDMQGRARMCGRIRGDTLPWMSRKLPWLALNKSTWLCSFMIYDNLLCPSDKLNGREWWKGDNVMYHMTYSSRTLWDRLRKLKKLWTTWLLARPMNNIIWYSIYNSIPCS